MQRNTRITLVTSAVAALLVLGALGVAMAHGGGRGGGLTFGDREPPGFSESDGTLDGRFVTATVDVANATVMDLDLKDANSTHPLVVSLVLGTPDGATTTASQGWGACSGGGHVGSQRGAGPMRGYTLDDGAGDRLAVPDTPHARFVATSVNGTTLTLVLPAGAVVTAYEAVDDWSPAGATVDYGNGQKARLVLMNATLAVAGQTLTVAMAAGGVAMYGVVPEDGSVGSMPSFGGAGPGAHGHGAPSRGPHDGGPGIGHPARGGHSW
jgi:hypothetical protein